MFVEHKLNGLEVESIIAAAAAVIDVVVTLLFLFLLYLSLSLSFSVSFLLYALAFDVQLALIVLQISELWRTSPSVEHRTLAHSIVRCGSIEF